MRRNCLRWTMSISLMALCCVPLGCDRSPSTKVDDAPPQFSAASTSQPSSDQSSPQSSVELGDTMKALQQRANDGDVASMVTLAQAFEGMGGVHKAQARQWYEKAAAKGDTSAKESLRMMNAADAAASKPADTSPTARGGQSSASLTPATSSADIPAAPADLAHLRWLDIVNSLDSHDFSAVTQPNFRKNPADVPIFVGVTTAADRMLTVAASGADADNLDAASVVLRIRTRDNLGTNNRVVQAGTICGVVTHGNVSQNDMLDWLNHYLQTGKKSEPIFRNGWSINVSGTDAEGIADPKKFLGEAVLIEMKK